MNHAPSPEPEIALSVVRNCLIASVRSGLEGDWAERTQRAVIHAVPAQRVRGVVFDVSAVRMIDSESFRHLSDTARMVALFGKEACFSGFQPGVVAALVGVGADVSGLRAFRTLEDAIGHICGAADVPDNPDDEEREDDDDMRDESAEEISGGNVSRDETGVR